MKVQRALRIGLVLAFVQAVLVGGFLAVESCRMEAPASFAWESLDEPAPDLELVRDGVPVPASAGAGPVLVHFWATWCGPCQTELPSLLAAASEEDVPLLALTDEPWSTVSAWFEGSVPTAIVRDPTGGAAALWQVSGLPDTFVLDRGRLTARMGGPRDWDSPDARRFLKELRP